MSFVNDALSDEGQLLHDKSVTISGIGSGSEPAHKPQVERQSCLALDTGRIWEWWNGTWH